MFYNVPTTLHKLAIKSPLVNWKSPYLSLVLKMALRGRQDHGQVAPDFKSLME
jgi:hypothetical protein